MDEAQSTAYICVRVRECVCVCVYVYKSQAYITLHQMEYIYKRNKLR